MFRFEHLDDVQSTLQRLIEREPPLVAMLQRQPGTKESRYMHLLSGHSEPAAQPASAARDQEDGRTMRLEEEFERLRAEVEEVKRQLADLRRQLE